MADPILITIEGDIGAGKSTLIDALKRSQPTWHFIDEPVSIWQGLQNEAGESLLELFYKDTDTYAYTFQNCAILSRAQMIQTAVRTWQADPTQAEHRVFLTERCLDTDYHVFAKMMVDTGKMGRLEWDLYRMWHSFAVSNSYPLRGIIHVSTPPAICDERIRMRGRKGEESIPLSYLETLETYQRKWLYETDHGIPLCTYVNYGDEGNQSRIDDVVKFVADRIQEGSQSARQSESHASTHA
jgi:deoxyadenosine/deoxycytidine kinase